MKTPSKILVVDVGGTNVKLWASGQGKRRTFPSGKGLTPTGLVAGVRRQARGWTYDAVSIGYPGPVRRDAPAAEPHNLARGWVGFDFPAAFGRPVKMINDAAMQALGAYAGGTMLFLGLGTGLGSALVVDGTVVPLELGHLGVGRRTFEDDLGKRGLRRLGKKPWRKRVFTLVERFAAAFLPDDVVLGGGNAKKLTGLPPGCRRGGDDDAFLGGLRLWRGAKP